MWVCTGTGYDMDHCRIEKMGCHGCNYYKEEDELNEQEISKCTNYKSDPTN